MEYLDDIYIIVSASTTHLLRLHSFISDTIMTTETVTNSWDLIVTKYRKKQTNTNLFAIVPTFATLGSIGGALLFTGGRLVKFTTAVGRLFSICMRSQPMMYSGASYSSAAETTALLEEAGSTVVEELVSGALAGAAAAGGETGGEIAGGLMVGGISGFLIGMLAVVCGSVKGGGQTHHSTPATKYTPDAQSGHRIHVRSLEDFLLMNNDLGTYIACTQCIIVVNI